MAEFAHDLCDVNRGTGGHLGLLLLLLLPDDDGTETGPSVSCILLQLGVTGMMYGEGKRNRNKVRVESGKFRIVFKSTEERRENLSFMLYIC